MNILRILLIAFALFQSVSFAQTKYDFTTGIGTTAQNHSTKLRTMYQIVLELDATDTAFYAKHYYTPSGYIICYEFQNGPISQLSQVHSIRNRSIL